MKYLVNVDWVEVYCRFDPLRFPSQYGTIFGDEGRRDFEIVLREYGTRVYANVGLIKYRGIDFATLCYNPLSNLGNGGIMHPAMCHIKLDNYWCYREDWLEVLKHAFRSFRINPIRLSRVDICCDVQHFACGLYAADLCQGLIKRKYYKVHQPNWAAHGKDSARIVWNSLSFGSTASPVFTRFYNKTLELCQKEDKQYIRECWRLVGFDDRRDIWRVEFSLSDTGREVIDTETGEQFDITLKQIADRPTLEGLFLRYASHYWDIRKNTGEKRYKCPKLQMFPPTPQLFRPVQQPHLGTCSRTDKLVVMRLVDAMIKAPNRSERWNILKSIELYQSVNRCEVLSDRDIWNYRQWMYADVSDDDTTTDVTKDNMLFAQSD